MQPGQITDTTTQCGNKDLVLHDFYEVLFGNSSVEIDEEALKKVSKSFEFLDEFAKGKVIYGVNTGFGSMAPYKIGDGGQSDLQYNLIRSHCSGTGELLPGLYVKSLMLARLNTLMLGYSGVHTDVTKLLEAFINHDVYPDIYEHGSVGASGDLVQLAHLGLALIGESMVTYKGERRNSDEVIKEIGHRPIEMHIRDGLAIMNGTSCMSGIGMVNLILARNLMEWMVVASVMINEIVEAYDDHMSDELNRVKKHRGQNEIARHMREMLVDSKLIRRREEYLYNGQIQEDVLADKVQEYYSLRCVPQILGPVYDTIMNAEKVLVEEVNSVNDNPIIDADSGNVFHGGNFHGDYVALEMDKLKVAVAKLSMLSERQINFLMNDKLNNKLPPFVNLGRLGFNFGMQGVQFTATSTVAENQTLSFPMYIHSIPNNNDNQDIVSMGTNAALLTKKVIENSYQVLAIEMLSIIQAVDYLKVEDKLCSYSRNIYKALRAVVPQFVEDRPKSGDIHKLKEHLLKNKLNLE